MKAVQFFSREYLEHARKLSPEEVVRFLEDFRLLHQQPTKSKLISIKMPDRLLSAFRYKCKLNNTPYQSQIKKLMEEWLAIGQNSLEN